MHLIAGQSSRTAGVTLRYPSYGSQYNDEKVSYRFFQERKLIVVKLRTGKPMG